MFLLDWATKQKRHTGRDEGDGQEQCRCQRHHYGLRHGMKHFSFHAFEREDRQVDRCDDEDPEQAGANHFGGRLTHRFQTFLQCLGAPSLGLF